MRALLLSASVVTLFGFQAACGQREVKMTPEAQQVEMKSEAQAAECGMLGPVMSEQGSNFGTYEGNVQLAQNDLRNKVAAMGGDTLVIKNTSRDSSGSQWGDDCKNCVLMQGDAYRCAK